MHENVARGLGLNKSGYILGVRRVEVDDLPQISEPVVDLLVAPLIELSLNSGTHEVGKTCGPNHVAYIDLTISREVPRLVAEKQSAHVEEEMLKPIDDPWEEKPVELSAFEPCPVRPYLVGRLRRVGDPQVCGGL